MAEPPPRCAARSSALDEPLHGTASTVSGWVLLEVPGPWGFDALRDCRLDAAVTGRLRELARRLRLRIVLIRKAQRSNSAVAAHRHCYLARTGPGEGWVEQAVLNSPEEVFDLDLEGLSRGRHTGLPNNPDPLYLVCTQGRHDPCCAERGRPVARRLAERFPDQSWEVSHIGGDRFAANLLVLPHGLYYGRLTPEDAVSVSEAYERGEVEPELLRGRSAYGFAVQAAECLLRSRTGIRGIDELPLLSVQRDGDDTEAVFAAPHGGKYLVAVRSSPAAPPRALTCSADRAANPPQYDLLELREQD